MSLQELLKLFVEILSDPAFKVAGRQDYRNRFGRPGVRWHGTLNRHLIFVSESATTVPSNPSELAVILAAGEVRLDSTKSGGYFASKRMGTGMRIEFRHRGRWFEVWSPDFECQAA
jgi:hypothetical protein